jgi:hypothetical protein
MSSKLPIERLQSLLVIGHSLNTHPQSGSGGGTRKGIPKMVGKLTKARAANIITKHPSHRDVFSISKHNHSKELVHKHDVVVLVDLHEGVNPKLLHDPKSFLKICMLLEMPKFNGLLGAHFVLGQFCIYFLENELLLFVVKGVLLGVLQHRKEIVLPHLSILSVGEIKHGDNSVKLGLLHPFCLCSLFLLGLHGLSITSLLGSHSPLHKSVLVLIILQHMIPRTPLPPYTARNMILTVHGCLGARRTRAACEMRIG